MPELPDVTAYLTALEPRILGARRERVRLLARFLLRSVDPPLSAAAGRTVTGLRRTGKRLVIALDGELFPVIHIMIAGRVHWKAAGAKPPARSASPPSTPAARSRSRSTLPRSARADRPSKGGPDDRATSTRGREPGARGNGHQRGLANLSVIPSGNRHVTGLGERGWEL